MRLQTFPDDYQLIGSRRSAQSQIGNAVPPDLAEIVARPLAEMLVVTQVHQQQELVVAGVA
jgi:DNA (cytosine-5)-methyltransferase 1